MGNQLPKALRITEPKVLEQSEQMQRDLMQRANSPFANLSPQEQLRVRAVRLVDELEKELSHAEDKHTLSCQLAEQYVLLGRYDKAAEIDPRPEHREEYIQILEAINRDDDETCGCPPNRQFVRQDIWSLRHDGVVTLVKCSGCGKMNARPIPAHLARQRELRAKARTMVEGLSPNDASDKLRAAGHTSKLL